MGDNTTRPLLFMIRKKLAEIIAPPFPVDAEICEKVATGPVYDERGLDTEAVKSVAHQLEATMSLRDVLPRGEHVNLTFTMHELIHFVHYIREVDHSYRLQLTSNDKLIQRINNYDHLLQKTMKHLPKGMAKNIRHELRQHNRGALFEKEGPTSTSESDT